MKWIVLSLTSVLLLLLVLASCGPEAQTGAVFSKYSAHACAAPSPADTLPPNRVGKALDKVKREESPASGVPTDDPAADTQRHFLLGKFDPAEHPDFVTIAQPYANRPGLLMQREAYAAFKKMADAARKDGVKLTIISATRTFDYQKNIWEKKWSNLQTQVKESKDRALKILEYSAMPGTSRHHWGTDIDLNDLNNASFKSGGSQARMYAWMQKHASDYGFCQPYTAKDEQRPTGYNEERWHWSYRPIADKLLQQYEFSVTDAMITGFLGAENARSIGIVQNYVLGVACKN
ncbi:MAG: M15 family metallopeptidase [Lewinellaceae bacterium]|nr:M15 family metallopeptidase [Lewinellaceae bacterium]